MGWHKRSIGKIYDSLFGHGFILGVQTINVISFHMKSKSCSEYKQAEIMNVEPKKHDCQVNWKKRASGGMEVSVVLELYKYIHCNSK